MELAVVMQLMSMHHTIAISPDEIKFSPLSWVDPVGQIFYWRGRVFRGIRHEAVSQVKDLFASGFLDELITKHLFPRTWITDFTLSNFPLVVEHEAIQYVTYPHEWSFDMLRDAAVTVLAANEVARKYGYQMQDCHGYNILFDGTKPKYIDLGSFIPSNYTSAFLPVDEFLGTYWYPLSIWSEGNAFLAKRIITSSNEVMPSSSYHLYKNALLRLVRPRRRHRWAKRSRRLLSAIANLLPENLERWQRRLLLSLPIECLTRYPDLLRERLLHLEAPEPDTFWHNYHSQYLEDGNIISSPRLDRIVQIVKGLPVESVLELAGNQGVLGVLLLNETQIRHSVITDYDPTAVNWLYQFGRDNSNIPEGKLLQPAILNFMVPEMDGYCPPPVDRLRADLVAALAVTHHLALSQGFPIKNIMKCIASYTREYGLIEYMPLGLWNGNDSPPLPSWYNQTWFEAAFTEFFDLLSVEEVEENRILYIGRLKQAAVGRAA
jgi:hypothetical protein